MASDIVDRRAARRPRLLAWLRAMALVVPTLQLRRFRRRARRRRAPLFVPDATGRRPRSKRALLVYLPEAFRVADDDPRLRAHQNLMCARRMADVLAELGFAVDVVDRRSTEFWPRRRYHLVVGERDDWNGLDVLFPAGAIHVYVATSLSHRLHNRNVRRRHELLEARGRPPVAIRRVYPEHLPAVRAADAVVGVGNAFTMGTWREVYEGPIHPFDNFYFPGTCFVEKDFEPARRRFLFFASRSQMQKGLDLLLEVFPRHPELELFVCSQFEQEADFCDAYRRELFETPNVHPIGTVSIDGRQFAELARSCAYVIHPSCSDGQAGAVVQGMGAGLIPIVTRETGVDVDGFGIELESDALDELERVLLDVAQRPPAWHRDASAATRQAAERTYSLDAFTLRWRAILETVLEAGPGGPRRQGP